MNFNVGVDNPAFIAWDGTESFPRKISGFNHFGFTFAVTTTLVADTPFNIFYHEPSDADPCLPGPAIPVPEIAFCDSVLEPGPQSVVILPAGTTPDTYCAGTIPCRNGQFISIAPVTPDTGEPENVQITLVFKGATR